MSFYLNYMDSALKPGAKKVTLDLKTECSSYSQAWQGASLFLMFVRQSNGKSETSLCYITSSRHCLKQTNKILQSLHRVEILKVDTKFVFLHSPLNMHSTFHNAGS